MTSGPDIAALRELNMVEALMRQRGLKPPKRPMQPRRLSPVETPKDAASLTVYKWARRYRRLEGRKFTLRNHKPLRQLYDDPHRHIVVQKPAQVGISEFAINYTLHALDVGAKFYKTRDRGLNVAYLFPKGRALSDFSKERLSGALNEHTHIAGLFEGGFDDIHFKQAGHSYLYLRSAWIGSGKKNRAAEGLLSFKADILVLDEFDRMERAAVELARKRMRASSVKREIDISTPTIPGVGISEAYLLSDQHVWEVPCVCGAWVEMEYFRDVRGNGELFEVWEHWDEETLLQAKWTVHCPHCQAELDRCGDGRWVSRNPRVQSVRGYQIPALAFPNIDLAKFATDAVSQDPSKKEEFFRSDLGLPFQAGGSSVTETLLDSLSNLPVPSGPYTRVTMGIDVGSRFHYRISGQAGSKRVVLAMGHVSAWDDLDDLVKRYQVRRVVIDAEPEIHTTEAWVKKWSGRAVRAFYPTGEQALQGELYNYKEEERKININRTMAMDAVYARLVGGVEIWPKSITRDPEVRRMMTAPTRVIVMDDRGQPHSRWVHTVRDDLYHACVYDLIAGMLAPKEQATQLVYGEATGWQPEPGM